MKRLINSLCVLRWSQGNNRVHLRDELQENWVCFKGLNEEHFWKSTSWLLKFGLSECVIYVSSFGKRSETQHFNTGSYLLLKNLTSAWLNTFSNAERYWNWEEKELKSRENPEKILQKDNFWERQPCPYISQKYWQCTEC